MSTALNAMFAIRGLWTFFTFTRMVFIIAAVTLAILFIRGVLVVMRLVPLLEIL